MSDLTTLAAEIIETCLPDSLLTPADHEALAQHRDWLLGLTDGLVALFYDRLYAHGPTAAVFAEGERGAREQTLREWWTRTVNGPIDTSYFSWMALVGVIHIRRKVQNPMMLSMFHVICDGVHEVARRDLGETEAERLRLALSHLSSTVASVISEAYTRSYIAALQDLAGLDPKLTERMLQIEVRDIESKGRAHLA